MKVQSANPSKAGGDTASGADPVGIERLGVLAQAGTAAPAARPNDVTEFFDDFRAELISELAAMARHHLSSGGSFDDATLALLKRLDAGENPPIEDFAAAHSSLSALVAPASPRAIQSLQRGLRARGWLILLGPTLPIRRLTATNLFFAVMFFGLSLSPHINHQTIALSIYDQSGLDLLIKVLFLMAAAGLGASFGALFEVWEEISEGRFDPVTESAHWMRIGLGLVAGLVLSEVVRTDANSDSFGGASVVAEPLLALVGGFSARLLHLVINRVVSAIESTFDPGHARPAPRPTPPQSAPVPPPVRSRTIGADAPNPEPATLEPGPSKLP